MSYKNRVLIVDDQALMRNHMHRLLKDEGYELAYAENGVEALEKINTFLPDLVLLDVRMPMMDGFEVCRRVRETPKTADIPIIMVTAFDDRDARLRGIEAGADDFIPKPYDSLELRARVRTITRLNRYRRLIDEKTKFQLVAELSENGYMLINEEDHISFANHQARLYLGLPVDMDSPINDTFTALTEKRYRRESIEAWKQWPGWPVDHQTRYLVRPETKKLPSLWIQVDTLDHLLSGSEMVWVISMRDVTNQMASKHDMWKFQRAIHHKMRTPLIGMYSGIQFLANYVNELSTDDISGLLHTALEHGERLRNAVEDVLRYIDTPSYARGGNNFQFSELVALVEQIRKTLEIDKINLKLTPGIENHTLVLSRESMEIILWEVLENAKKFHPDNDPTITLLAHLTKDQKGAVLRVIDNGVSLTPEQLRRVWQPYYQPEKNFTGEIAGMGLGLSTVASLVWGIGGLFQVNNRQDGTGVEVTLAVPLFDPQESAV